MHYDKIEVTKFVAKNKDVMKKLETP